MIEETNRIIENENIKEIAEININQLPMLLNNQLRQMVECREIAEQAEEKAKVASNAAQTAKEAKKGFFNNTKAIGELQDAVVEGAEAQELLAKANTANSKYMQTLAEMNKFALAVGVSNATANRTIFRELKMYMEHASEEELSEFERAEIEKTLQQLNAQHNMMIEQGNMKETLKVHDGQLNDHETRIIKQEEAVAQQDHDILLMQAEEKRLNVRVEYLRQQSENRDENIQKELNQKNNEQDIELERQASFDMELNKKIDESVLAIAEKNKNQDIELKRQANEDKEIRKIIDEVKEHNKTQDEQIELRRSSNENNALAIEHLILHCEKMQTEIDDLKLMYEELKQEIDASNKNIDELGKSLTESIEKKIDKKYYFVSLGIAIMAFVFGIINFFM